MSNMQRQLEYQADTIEAILAANTVPSKITGGSVTPLWIRFHALPAIGTKVSEIRELSEKLATALNVNACRILRRGASVDIEISRDNPKPFRLSPLYDQLKNIPPVTAILGLQDDGAPLLIRLPAPTVKSVLICGKPGIGKTMLLKAMTLSLIMENVDVAVMGFEDFPSYRINTLRELRKRDKPLVLLVDDAIKSLELRQLVKYGHLYNIYPVVATEHSGIGIEFGCRIEGYGNTGNFTVVGENSKFWGAYVTSEEIANKGKTCC